MTTEPAAPAIRLRRLVPASREEVFAAWTRPGWMRRWFAPEPATVGSVETDPRPGGRWRVRMEGPEGETWTCRGTYREVAPPTRLAFTFDWEEEESRMGRDTLVTVTFEEVEGGTEVVLVHEGFPGPDAAAGHDSGWAACLDQLAGVWAEE